MSTQLTSGQKIDEIRIIFRKYGWTIFSDLSCFEESEIDLIYDLYKKDKLSDKTQNPITWAYYGAYFILKHNYSLALTWNNKSADSKNVDGIINVAYQYMYGFGVDKNVQKAIDMLEPLIIKSERAMAYLLIYFCDDDTKIQYYINYILKFASLHYINILTTRLHQLRLSKYDNIIELINQRVILLINSGERQETDKHEYAVLFYNLAVEFEWKKDLSNALMMYIKSAELEQDQDTLKAIIDIIKCSDYQCLDFVKKYLAQAQDIKLKDEKIEYLKLKPQGISVEQAEQDFLLHQQNLKSQN